MIARRIACLGVHSTAAPAATAGTSKSGGSEGVPQRLCERRDNSRSPGNAYASTGARLAAHHSSEAREFVTFDAQFLRVIAQRI
jgi:hypothetical protein